MVCRPGIWCLPTVALRSVIREISPSPIIISERVKLIQPTELASVRAIHVREGAFVRKGDVLVELDGTNAEAEDQQVRAELLAAEREISWLEAYLSALDAKPAKYPLIHDAKLLREAVTEYQKRNAALAQSMSGKRAELEALQQNIFKLEQTTPLLEKRADSLRELAERKLVSEHQWLEIQSQLISSRQDLAIARNQKTAVMAEFEKLRIESERTQSEYRKDALERLKSTTQKRAALEHDQSRTRQRRSLQQLRAPVDGVVQQLTLHTVGGVVQPAEKLMVIVPLDTLIEVEVQVMNKDIGFVRNGQQAVVKVDAFPYTRFGTVDGTILSVSRDAVQDEQLGWVFPARIRLRSNALRVDHASYPLSNSMSVVAEVHTGQQTLMEYLLIPVLGRLGESMRER